MDGYAHAISGRRERQKAQTRQRVLDAARALFTSRGFEAVTIKMIADTAGVAVGSVFTTFESKSEVLTAIAAEELARHVVAADAAIAGVAGVQARLCAFFGALYRYHDRHLALLIQAQAHAWVRTLEAERAVRQSLIPTMKRVERLLRDGQRTRELAEGIDVRTLVEVLWACFIANYRGAAFDGWSSADMAERMANQIAVVLRGAGLQGQAADSRG